MGGNPLQLVVALYEGAIESVGHAKQALVTGDPMARASAVNRAMRLLTQLLTSLDQEKGGEISQNLKRLYSYLLCRLMDGHAKQSEQPFAECERLLNTLLEGWREIAAKPQTYDLPEGFAAAPTASFEDSYQSPDYFFSGNEVEFTGAVSATF